MIKCQLGLGLNFAYHHFHADAAVDSIHENVEFVCTWFIRAYPGVELRVPTETPDRASDGLPEREQ